MEFKVEIKSKDTPKSSVVSGINLSVNEEFKGNAPNLESVSKPEIWDFLPQLNDITRCYIALHTFMIIYLIYAVVVTLP